MPKTLTYINTKGQSIQIGYFDPFYLENFDGGTSIPKINIYTSKGTYQDGASYTGSTMDMRNIVIDFRIENDFVSNRNILYGIFIPKSEGILVFEQDSIKRKINCLVESLTIDDNTVPKTATLSLLSPRPFWEDIDSIRNDIAAWLPSFEFPLEIIPEGIEMGYRQLSLVVNVKNSGNITLGMVIEFRAIGTVASPSIFDVYKRKELKINTIMQAGDIITVCTIYGKKKIELNRSGVISNLINYLDSESEFLQLEPGDNLLRYNAEQNLDNLEVSIYYTPAYLGV
ncbi:phage tail family protein [Ruminiclostridium herbifermentans]|uniref:Phage tail family protein n=1 Tax=Ruminiclostridium herbifermentans TaxID=2488810 RepID=A0A4U7JBF1_9FIRM|nr:phage tail family protein [Ruminiclostridium herbifermentans]QNU66914.1 phage tail family protein [Ruminiclostridium herbifermentans]